MLNRAPMFPDATEMPGAEIVPLHPGGPRNAGKPWSEADDCDLLFYDAGPMPIEAAAAWLKRTPQECAVRLTVLHTAGPRW